MDFSEQAAALNGKPLTLSPMEYKMLYLFCKNVRVLRLDKSAQVVAVPVRQIDVQQHQVIFCPGQQIFGGPGVQGGGDTVVIFLTANDQESDQIQGYEAGAVDSVSVSWPVLLW